MEGVFRARPGGGIIEDIFNRLDLGSFVFFRHYTAMYSEYEPIRFIVVNKTEGYVDLSGFGGVFRFTKEEIDEYGALAEVDLIRLNR